MKKSNLKIRALTEDDLGAIVEIDKKILGKRREDYWKRKIALADIYPRPSFVAELNGKVVGMIIGYVSGWEFGIPSSVGWIDTIGVDPAHQKHGIARALFNELVKNLKLTGKQATPDKKVSETEGVDTVYTLVDWYDTDLLKFFQKMGFKRGDMTNLEFKL